MIADFLGPYLVTIAGVVTTGVAAFLLRSLWRWSAATDPLLLNLLLIERGFRLRNDGDFTIHVLRVEALPPGPHPWSYEFPRARRLAPSQWVELQFDADTVPAVRGDRDYRVKVRDAHRALWDLFYAANSSFGGGATPSSVRRIWPRTVGFLRDVA